MDRTIDSIVSSMAKLIADKIPITPEQWLDGAMFLRILSLDETTKLVELECKTAEIKRKFIDEGSSNADADSRMKATKEYKEYRLQKNRVDFIESYILLSKKYASVNAEHNY